jgi:hypothetical protein
MRQLLSKVGRRLAVTGLAGLLGAIGAVAIAAPASALGSFILVGEASGVGGAQAAGTLLRLTPPVDVADVVTYAEPWPTTPASGLRVRTSRCNGTTPTFLPISLVRKPALAGNGAQDIVVYYPSSTDVGYGTCSYRGLVTLRIIPPGGGEERIQTLVITN